MTPSLLFASPRLLGLDGRSSQDSHQQINGGGQECPPHTSRAFALLMVIALFAGETPALPLDVQILHVERVVFDEFPAGLYVFAH